MADLGVVRIRMQWKLLGHLTLYFLCSKCLHSAPVLPTVQNCTFETDKRRHAERGGEASHNPTVLLDALPINTMFPTVTNLNFPSTTWWWGKYFSEEIDFLSLHFQKILPRSILRVYLDFMGRYGVWGGERGVSEGEEYVERNNVTNIWKSVMWLDLLFPGQHQSA